MYAKMSEKNIRSSDFHAQQGKPLFLVMYRDTLLILTPKCSPPSSRQLRSQPDAVDGARTPRGAAARTAAGPHRVHRQRPR